MKQIRKKQLCAALAAAMGAGMTLSMVAGSAQAQQTAQTKERIEVTGSNIKRVDQEGPNPVAVIRREDMERSAGQNLSDILTNLSVANLGSYSETRQSGNSFAPGTSAISLRGLGPQTTLVLINGRRLANYGFAQNINEAFVDLNSIPVSAIERIEILKAGASAIYGSDAIAGVVNIILRKDFKGVEGSLGYGQSSRHDADETRANLTAGFGDINTQRFNIMGTLDYYKRDPLFGDARERAATADYRRFYGGLDLRSPSGSPGTWLTAASSVPAAQRLATNTVFPTCSAEARDQALDPLGTCAYNFEPDVMILPKTERKGAFARGVFEFSPTLSAFAEIGWNKNDSFTQLAPTPDAFTLPVGHNSNPYPFPVQIRYRFTDVGPRISNQLSETQRYVLGLKGSFKDWDWEAAYVDAHNEIVENRANFIATPVRNALVSANVYSFVNPSSNSPALAAGLRANPQRNGDSKMQSYDAKLSGTVTELPAGPLGLALGAEHRKESVKDVPDPLGAQGLIIGAGGTAADGGRTSSGFFGELSIPITRTLEGQLALRHERYSDYGNSTVPKYALAWRATPNVLLRAGYDEGFRAPALAELYLGQSVSFQSVVDSTRCTGYRAAFGNSDPRTAGACASLQYRSVTGGNPDLTAEKSKSETLGVIWDITPRLSSSLDYYRITHEQRIATPSTTFLVANEDLFPGGVTRDPQTPNDVIANTRGPIVGSGSDERVGIRQFYFNAQSQATRGVDLEVRYRTPIGSWGNLSLSSLNTYVEYFRRSVAPGQVPVELAGNDRFPRYRGVHSAIWNRGPWDASLTVNTIGSYRQPNQSIPGVDLSVASWNTADIQASWSGIKWVKLTAGVRNVLDKDPPFYNNESSGGYDTFTHSIIGRFYYGRMTVSFR
jgi:iron complex outermembrane receptor protein